MKKGILFVLIILSIKTNAQDRNSVWIFGDSAGIDFSNLSNSVPIASGMDGRGSCVSIADSLGNIILYANTEGQGDWATTLRNSLGIIIPNSDSFSGFGWYNELALFPRPNNGSQYYLFCYGEDEPNNQGVFYSIIDMALNSGLGSVTTQNVQINNLRQGDCLSAVKHGNGRDWWVISKLSDINGTQHNRFFVYLVTSDSIYAPIVQDFNDATDVDFQKIIFKKNGNSFMLINLRGFMAEYNFDRCSGQITHIRTILNEYVPTPNTHPFYWEGAYSPNGNMFYTSTTQYFSLATSGYLIQYDLQSTNIIANADTLEIFQTPIGTGALRLAPDNKIYFSKAYEWGFPGYPYPDSVYNIYNMNLSVINSPDSIGSACNYQPFSFYLGGKRTYYGLPNNPNYDLGPLVGSFCDSLTVGISNNEQGILNVELEVNYNPSLQTAFINANNLKGRRAELLLYDLAGKVVY